MEVREPAAATRHQLELAHASEHIDRIEALCSSGGGTIDLETIVSAGSWEAALRSAGAGCDAIDLMAAGEADSAFCALRPPGHHAERDRATGFCLFNNAAVAAAHAIDTGAAERVLILDWDVHHGNGTEEIFRASAEVLYASIHEWPLYPGTGAAEYRGEGEGEGYTVNLPVPGGSGTPKFTALVEHVVVPVARRFEPGLVIVSAGFDAHRADPLSTCEVDEGGFRRMAASVASVATELEAPILVCLEGGYELGALARSSLAMLGGLGVTGEAEAVDPAPARAEIERLAGSWGF